MKKLSRRHMEVVEMPYVLLHFLIANRCLTQCLNNIVKRANNIEYRYLQKESYITSAFIWYRTPEGHNYWSDLDIEYRRFIRLTL